MSDALCWLSAAELARSIRTKQVSTIDVVRAHRDRIVALNPRLNAIVALNPHAEEEARAADAAVMNGHDLGPLHGVPFTVKDCIDTAGLQTTRGSRLFANYIPSTDATAVLRLKAAGGILLAKTNVPEFSFDRETANAVLGRSVNPWNPDRTPGMITWYMAPVFGIPRGGCQMSSSACPGLATISVTFPVLVSTGLGSSQGASATRSDGYAWK